MGAAATQSPTALLDGASLEQKKLLGQHIGPPTQRCSGNANTSETMEAPLVCGYSRFVPRSVSPEQIRHSLGLARRAPRLRKPSQQPPKLLYHQLHLGIANTQPMLP